MLNWLKSYFLTEYVTITVTIVHKTDGGYLVEYEGTNAWIPSRELNVAESDDKEVEITISKEMFEKKFS